MEEGRSPGRFTFAHTSSTTRSTTSSARPGGPAPPPGRRGAGRTSAAGTPARVRGARLPLASATTPRLTLKAPSTRSRPGDRALAALAPDEARDWFTRALEVLDQTPEADPGQRCDAVIGLGDAQRQLGDPEYSETLLEACELAREIGDGARMARAAEANTRGFASGVGQVDQRRVDALEAALELCAEDSQRASLLSLLAVELCYDAALERRLSLSGEAVRLARESGDRHALAWCMARRQIAIAAPETLDERLAEAGEMVALANELDDPMLRYWAHVWRAMDALEVGDFETQALDRGRAGGDRRGDRTADVSLGQHLRPSAAGDDGRRLRPRRGDHQPFGRAGDPRSGQPNVLAMFTRRRSTSSATSRGASTRCVEIQEQAMEETPLLDAYSSALASAASELDQTARRRGALLERFAANATSRWPRPRLEGGARALHADRGCGPRPGRPGRRRGALRAAAAVARSAQLHRGDDVRPGRALPRPDGATCLGRYEDAAAHFRRSAATCERIEAPTWLARTRHEWALMLPPAAGRAIARPPTHCWRRRSSPRTRYGCRSLERGSGPRSRIPT